MYVRFINQSTELFTKDRLYKVLETYNGKRLVKDNDRQNAFVFDDEVEIVQENEKKEDSVIKSPDYYDNSKISIYQIAEHHKLNSYEFDLIKRIIRCRKKGDFLNDLNKSKTLIDIYIKEHKLNK